MGADVPAYGVREIWSVRWEIGRSRTSLPFPQWFPAGKREYGGAVRMLANSKWSFGASLELFGVYVAAFGNLLITLLMNF